MTVKRLFSLVLLGISLIGFCGSLPLDLLREENIGPGFAPMLYSICLGVCSVFLFFQKDGSQKIELRKLFQKPALDSTFFFVMLFVSYGLAILVGMLPALGIFSLTVLLQQNKLTKLRIAVFEILFMLFVYLLFTKLLRVPFERGLLLR